MALVAAKIGLTFSPLFGFRYITEIAIFHTRKYPLHGYILGLGAPGTPGVMG